MRIRFVLVFEKCVLDALPSRGRPLVMMMLLLRPGLGVQFAGRFHSRCVRVHGGRCSSSFEVERVISPKFVGSVTAGYRREACAEFAGHYPPLLVLVIVQSGA